MQILKKVRTFRCNFKSLKKLIHFYFFLFLSNLAQPQNVQKQNQRRNYGNNGGYNQSYNGGMNSYGNSYGNNDQSFGNSWRGSDRGNGSGGYRQNSYGGNSYQKRGAPRSGTFNLQMNPIENSNNYYRQPDYM